MSNLRTGEVPLEHVVAELLAAPFVQLSDELTLSGSGQLWRACETRLLTTLPSFSVDELVAMRDRLWFSDLESGELLSRPPSLGDYLRRLASVCLRSDGDCARVQSWSPWREAGRDADALARRQARWIFLAVPEDLLLAALPGSPHTCIGWVSEGLRRRLQDQGYAIVHQHAGASLSFATLWERTMGNIRTLPSAAFKSPNAELKEGSELGPWLLAAAFGRLVVGHFLAARRNRASLRFDTFLTEYLERRTRFDEDRVREVLQGLQTCAIQHLAASRESWADHQLLLRDMVADCWWPESLTDNADPLSPLFPGSDTVELHWTREALNVLAEQARTGSPDRQLEALIWQCVRVRVQLYRHVVQRPLVPGLAWFMRQFERIRPGRGQDLNAVRETLSLEGRHGLAALELRTSPGAELTFYTGLIRQTLNATRSRHHRELKVGWALHFSRDRGGGHRKGTTSSRGLPIRSGEKTPAFEEDPRIHNFRFAGHYRKLRQQAVVWGHFLELFPGSLSILRAIDVCSDEQGVPTWVIAPLFRYVGEVSLRCSERLWEHRGIRLSPLRRCPHAGEDFVHLASGLRRIDEALRLLGMQEGDRLGHGLALGLDPHRWAAGVGRVTMSLDHRFFDLAWERAFWLRHETPAPMGRFAWLSEEVDRLARELFGFACDWVEVSRFLELLYDEQALSTVGFPDYPLQLSPHWREGDAKQLLWLYLSNTQTYLQSQRMLVINPGPDAEALRVIQGHLRQALRDRHITLEVNATGNLLIGNYRDLSQHPIWELAPFRAEQPGQPDLLYALSADNPITFNTSVAQEYQLVDDTLQSLGASQTIREQWLSRSMKAGVQASFVEVPRHHPHPFAAFPSIQTTRLPP